MFGTRFYNETIKRAVSIFGTLFNNIDVADIKTDGTVLNIRKVPISCFKSKVSCKTSKRNRSK